MALVLARRYEPACYAGALAVAAIIAGWAHAAGAGCLLAFVVLGAGAVAPHRLAEADGEPAPPA